MKDPLNEHRSPANETCLQSVIPDHPIITGEHNSSSSIGREIYNIARFDTTRLFFCIYVGQVDGISFNSFVMFTLHILKMDDARVYGCMICARTSGVSAFDNVMLVVESE